MDLSWPSVLEGLALGLGMASGVRASFKPDTDHRMRVAFVLWFISYIFVFGGQSFLSNSERAAYYVQHVIIYLYRSLFVLLFATRLSDGYNLKYRWWPCALIAFYSIWHLGWIFASLPDVFASCLVGTWSGGCRMTLTHRVLRTGTDATLVILIVSLDSVFVYHLIHKLRHEHGVEVLSFHTNVYHAVMQTCLLIAVGANIYRLTRLPFNDDLPPVYSVWLVQDVIAMLLLTEFGCRYALVIKASLPNTSEQDLEAARVKIFRVENSKNNMLRYLHHELRNNLQRMSYLSDRMTSPVEHSSEAVSDEDEGEGEDKDENLEPHGNHQQQSFALKKLSTLHSIQTCSAYIANVVEDVLTIENFESGALPIRPRSFDLTRLIRSEFTHFEQFADARGRRIELKNALPNSYQVIGDSDRIRQILRILGESCIEHSSLSDNNLSACAKVNGSLVVQLAPAVGEIFSVTLTDPYTLLPGDDPHDLSHSVVRRLLKAVHGHILLDPERREAQIIIPVELDVSDTHASVISLRLSDTRPTVRFKMLVVDDVRMNRALLSKILQKVCLNRAIIHEAENGQVATDLILRDGHVFDVIWMDMVMPEKDGLSACQEIKSVLPTTIIIMVSANDLSQDERTRGPTGPDETITKPVKRQAIETILKRQKLLST